MVLVAGLMVVLVCIFRSLSEAPRFIVTLEFHSLIHGERRNSDARETEVVRTIEVSGFQDGASGRMSRRNSFAMAWTMGKKVVRSAPETSTSSGEPSGGTSSKFRPNVIFPAGMGGCLPRYSEPSGPCSSAVTDAKRIERCRLLRCLAVGVSQFEEDRASGRVVIGPVVNVVAGHIGTNAEVIVVCGEHHRFVFSFVSEPGRTAITLFDANGLTFAHHVCNQLVCSGSGLKSRERASDINLSRSRSDFYEISRDSELPNPRLLISGTVEFEIRFLARVGIADDVPSIAGHIGAVNENGADCTLASGFFVFIGPTTVVGKCASLEKFGIVGARFVHEHEENLALDVDAFVVVPTVFGGFDSIAHENDVGVNVGRSLLSLVVRNVFVEILQIFCLDFRGRMSAKRVSGRVVIPTIGTRCMYDPLSPAGFSPYVANCVAMYSAAMSPPRCPVPRPSSRSWDKKAAYSRRMRSGLIPCIARKRQQKASRVAVGSAAGFVWENAATDTRIAAVVSKLFHIGNGLLKTG